MNKNVHAKLSAHSKHQIQNRTQNSKNNGRLKRAQIGLWVIFEEISSNFPVFI